MDEHNLTAEEKEILTRWSLEGLWGTPERCDMCGKWYHRELCRVLGVASSCAGHQVLPELFTAAREIDGMMKSSEVPWDG